MIYIIVGMHKSGTTLISKILHESGINMGIFDKSIGYDSGNQYERDETQKLNMILLDSIGVHSLNVNSPINVSKIILERNKHNFEKTIESISRRHESWGFKDPRTCLTYTVWAHYLPEHKLIYVFRSPHEVWAHYQKKISKLNIIKKTLTGWNSLKAWHTYNNLCLHIIKNTKLEFIAVEYSEFMKNNDGFFELEKFIGINLKDCRTSGLYRAKAPKNIVFDFFSFLHKKLFDRDILALYENIKSVSKLKKITQSTRQLKTNE